MRGSSFGYNNMAIESSYLRLVLGLLVIIY
jgi:3-deoxy-D-manno-octulosonic acid (KDO) 8-phosphate synthase